MCTLRWAFIRSHDLCLFSYDNLLVGSLLQYFGSQAKRHQNKAVLKLLVGSWTRQIHSSPLCREKGTPLPTPSDNTKHSVFVPLVIRSFCTICHFWSSFPADYIPRIYVPNECELAGGVKSVSKERESKRRMPHSAFHHYQHLGFPPNTLEAFIKVILKESLRTSLLLRGRKSNGSSM